MWRSCPCARCKSNRCAPGAALVNCAPKAPITAAAATHENVAAGCQRTKLSRLRLTRDADSAAPSRRDSVASSWPASDKCSGFGESDSAVALISENRHDCRSTRIAPSVDIASFPEGIAPSVAAAARAAAAGTSLAPGERHESSDTRNRAAACACSSSAISLVRSSRPCRSAQQRSSPAPLPNRANEALPSWLRVARRIPRADGRIRRRRLRRGPRRSLLAEPIPLNATVTPRPTAVVSGPGAGCARRQEAGRPGRRAVQGPVRPAHGVRRHRQRQHAVAVRVGRQELAFGEQRLVGHVSWLNTARTFDGARATFAASARHGRRICAPRSCGFSTARSTRAATATASSAPTRTTTALVPQEQRRAVRVLAPRHAICATESGALGDST